MSGTFAEGYGAGKVILLGEHSVVYGRSALAAGLPDGIGATIQPGDGRIICPEWSLHIPLDHCSSMGRAVLTVLAAVGLQGSLWDIRLAAHLPHSAGLGSSAALCVAVARAAAALLGKGLASEQAAQAAFQGECCFHGTPSGIDNTVAALGGILWFRKPDQRRQVHTSVPLPLVIAHSGQAGETATQVALVRERYLQAPRRIESIFDHMEMLVESATDALGSGRFDVLGSVMNEGHACLQHLGVSSERLDEMVLRAREAGALGAKLTGAGGGGCIVALCPAPELVAEKLEIKGFPAFVRWITQRANHRGTIDGSHS